MCFIIYLSLNWNETGDKRNGFYEVYLICKDREQYQNLEGDWFDDISEKFEKFGIEYEMLQYFEKNTNCSIIPPNKNIIDVSDK